MKRLMALVPVLAALECTGVAPTQAASVPYEQWGYLTVSDGTQLRYDVVRPSRAGTYPVALEYDPYGAGNGYVGSTSAVQTKVGGADPLAKDLLADGYAVMGLSIRGTGCSGGHFDVFDPASARDGAEAVEWAARQPWSTGRVGMFGLSYPGIVQLMVAGQRPPHLDAIAPLSVVTDVYRDVAYPGGIFNTAFTSLFSVAFQPLYSDSSAVAAAEGDATCLVHLAEHQVLNLPYNAYLGTDTRAYDGAWYRTRAPGRYVTSIDIPTLACDAWQDDLASSRNGSFYLDGLNPQRTWVLGTNGYHGICSGEGFRPIVTRFLDHFVKGAANGFESTPRVELLHDMRGAAGAEAPGWVSLFPSWPVPTVPVHLDFARGGILAGDTSTGADSFAYPLPAGSTGSSSQSGETARAWNVPLPPGGAVVYTTPALTNDAEFFGPGSVNLWLSSTATDTDLQVTLTEIRPDGQETYVERGWLRASHRKLDPALSTALRPYQTHLQSDVESLTPGQPAYARVELFPFDYVFRAGSSIRLTVESPSSTTGLWGLDFIKTPAVNTILHDATHASELVLGLIPGGHATTPLPACDSVNSQPCRAGSLPAPAGHLTIGVDGSVTGVQGETDLTVANPVSAGLTSDRLPVTGAAADGDGAKTAVSLMAVLLAAAARLSARRRRPLSCRDAMNHGQRVAREGCHIATL